MEFLLGETASDGAGLPLPGVEGPWEHLLSIILMSYLLVSSRALRALFHNPVVHLEGRAGNTIPIILLFQED